MRRTKIIILMVTLVVLIYDSSMVFAQNAYPGYDKRYDLLIGGIQIEITAEFYCWPWYSLGFASLAFPVTFLEDGYRKNGFITAGHAVNPPLCGGSYIDQPTKGSWAWENYIGRAIRRVFLIVVNQI